MVASEVRVVLSVIRGVYQRATAVLDNSQRDLRLEPVVVETDAQPFGCDGIRHDLMAQPALEQYQVAGNGRDGDPRAIRAPGIGPARRRGHEPIQPWVLEFDPRRARGHVDIVGAAQGRQGMQVQTMYYVPRHDIDPAIGHCEFAAFEVPLYRRCESFDVPLKLALQGFEAWVKHIAADAMIRRTYVAAGIVLLPTTYVSCAVVLAQLPAFLQQLAVGVLESPYFAGRPYRRRWGRTREWSSRTHCEPGPSLAPIVVPAMKPTVPASMMPVATASQG